MDENGGSPSHHWTIVVIVTGWGSPSAIQVLGGLSATLRGRPGCGFFDRALWHSYSILIYINNPYTWTIWVKWTFLGYSNGENNGTPKWPKKGQNWMENGRSTVGSWKIGQPKNHGNGKVGCKWENDGIWWYDDQQYDSWEILGAVWNRYWHYLKMDQNGMIVLIGTMVIHLIQHQTCAYHICSTRLMGRERGRYNCSNSRSNVSTCLYM